MKARANARAFTIYGRMCRPLECNGWKPETAVGKVAMYGSFGLILALALSSYLFLPDMKAAVGIGVIFVVFVVLAAMLIEGARSR